MSSRLGKKCYGTYESVPLFLDAVDIANVLGIPKSDVYFMFHAVDFPIITIGGRMIVRKEELNHIQKGNYYIMTHIDCGIYNDTKKLTTTLSTTFTPISETDAKKVVSNFPKGFGYPRLSLRYHDFDYYDLYNGFPEVDDYGLYCRDDDRWDYGNI